MWHVAEDNRGEDSGQPGRNQLQTEPVPVRVVGTGQTVCGQKEGQSEGRECCRHRGGEGENKKEA